MLIAPATFLLVLYSFQRINFAYLVNASGLLVFPVHGYLFFVIALIPENIPGIPAMGMISSVLILFVSSACIAAALKKKSVLKMLLFWLPRLVLSITTLFHPSLQVFVDKLVGICMLSATAIASIWLGFRKPG